MRYLATEQMREADRRCIEELGIPGAVLMNNAGAAVFARIARGPVGIVCGKGNNGGDGFVVARLSLVAGYETRVVLTARKEDMRGDAAIFMRAYERLGGNIVSVVTEEEAARAVSDLADCAVLVDALLGTGARGEVRGVIRTAMDAWPKAYTLAVDLPSGLNADTGAPCGACIRADETVTFAFAKKGFACPEAEYWLGKVHVADIGIPECCADDDAWAALKQQWAAV